MVHLWSIYTKVVEKRKNKKVGETKYTLEVKYTIYNYALALQYRLYEAII